MQKDQLEAYFLESEADWLERKESVTDDDRIRQAICAFANDLPNHQRPGVFFVGQRDDLSCASLHVGDDLLTRLGAFRSDGKILPFPVMSVTRETLNGCTVAVIIVEPSDNPPVRLDGRTWIRIGPRRGVATAEEERRLVEKRRWGNLPFDTHGVRGATLDDIDLRRFHDEYLPASIAADVLRENGRPEKDQLRALRLLRPDDSPTVAAILLLGKNPRAWVPGAYVQFLRIDGPNLTDPVRNQRNVDGTLGDQLRVLDELIRLNIEQSVQVGGATRHESWDYPEVALRQLLRNALLHRSYDGTNAPVRVTWYNDRVEILNPGGPYGQVTKANFGQPGITDYRNPTLAEALRNLKYVEQFGVGIALARDSLAKNGNPPPQFVVEDEHVHVTLRRSS